MRAITNKSLAIIGFLLLFPSLLFSQQKEKVSINNNWSFIKSKELLPENVIWYYHLIEEINLPHTWNDKDVLDEAPGYYRGGGWYKKTISLTPGWEKKRVFLEFEAANQTATVFINNKNIANHIGGYSGFRIDITEYLNKEDFNFDLCVRVDNSFNEDIPPLTADFTFFGGIYREAWIIYAPETHFSLDHYGGPGVYWQTPSVSHEKAEVKIFGFLSNYSLKNKRIKVEHILKDSNGTVINKETFKQSLKQGKNLSLNLVSFTIDSPILWSTKSPVTYSIISRLIDIPTGKIIDEEINPIAFRWFEFTADKGFFLNGNHLKIRGQSRHQDYPGLGNALQEDSHYEDMLSTKEMGANFMRIAHYPQDQSVISICDTIGLLTSLEIPVVNRITESEKFTQNSLMMMKEMIWQNYNHPSLIMWTYMNEVLLRPPFLDEPERLKQYYSNVTVLAEKLEIIARELDPYRVTMIPNHGSMTKYNDAKLTEIPMVVGWNLYQGWYGSDFGGFGRYLDNHRKILPDKPILITEYGAGHDPRLVSFESKRFDFTAEYAMSYHKKYVEEIEKRDFVSGSMIWILNDFSSEERGDAVPTINSKGIRSADREPKESYWYYKSIWSESPFIKIWTPFPGILISSKDSIAYKESGTQIVKIYTNAEELKIFLNGENLGVFKANSGLIKADLPLKSGENNIKAIIPELNVSDSLIFEFLNDPAIINPESENIILRISCGDHRYFWDDEQSNLWLPDQPYTKDNWGYIGGNAFTVKTRHGVKPSSDQQITGTSLDPVFQTQRIAPEEYRFDIPSGSYEITLLFAELNSESELANLAYNLGEDNLSEKLQKRVFSVEINGTNVLESMNLFESYGSFKAVEKTFNVIIPDENGLQIKFHKKQGEAVISGIMVRSLESGK